MLSVVVLACRPVVLCLALLLPTLPHKDLWGYRKPQYWGHPPGTSGHGSWHNGSAGAVVCAHVGLQVRGLDWGQLIASAFPPLPLLLPPPCCLPPAAFPSPPHPQLMTGVLHPSPDTQLRPPVI